MGNIAPSESLSNQFPDKPENSDTTHGIGLAAPGRAGIGRQGSVRRGTRPAAFGAWSIGDRSRAVTTSTASPTIP